jgi:hypothetical protein
MEHLIGRLCELTFQINGKSLYFLANVDIIDDTHIYFTDKFNNKFGFRKSDLMEIKEVSENVKDKSR